MPLGALPSQMSRTVPLRVGRAGVWGGWMRRGIVLYPFGWVVREWQYYI